MNTACSDPGAPPTGTRRFLQASARIAFTSGTLGAVLGQFVTFYPGAEQAWFTLCGSLVLAGLALPKWPDRIPALLIAAFCVMAAIQGHQRGEDYKKHLAKRQERSFSR